MSLCIRGHVFAPACLCQKRPGGRGCAPEKLSFFVSFAFLGHTKQYVGVTPGSGITLDCAWGSYGLLGIEPRSTTCKENALSSVPLLWPHQEAFCLHLNVYRRGLLNTFYKIHGWHLKKKVVRSLISDLGASSEPDTPAAIDHMVFLILRDSLSQVGHLSVRWAGEKNNNFSCLCPTFISWKKKTSGRCCREEMHLLSPWWYFISLPLGTGGRI